MQLTRGAFTGSFDGIIMPQLLVPRRITRGERCSNGSARRRCTHIVTAASTDTDAPSGDAFAELVRLAVEKDPSLAPLAAQHLGAKATAGAGGAATSPSLGAQPHAMLGPSLAALPNSSKPAWLRQRAPQGEKYGQLYEQMRSLKLATVCEEAQCPNIGECWNGSMGACAFIRRQDLANNYCRRSCSFPAHAPRARHALTTACTRHRQVPLRAKSTTMQHAACGGAVYGTTRPLYCLCCCYCCCCCRSNCHHHALG